MSLIRCYASSIEKERLAQVLADVCCNVSADTGRHRYG
jgi:hypothetical protein